MNSIIRRLAVVLTFLLTVGVLTPTFASGAGGDDPFSLPAPPPPKDASNPKSNGPTKPDAKETKPSGKGDRTSGPKAPKSTGCPFGTITDEESEKERCMTTDEHDEALIAKIMKVQENKVNNLAWEMTTIFAIVLFILTLIVLIWHILWTRGRVKQFDTRSAEAVSASQKAEAAATSAAVKLQAVAQMLADALPAQQP